MRKTLREILGTRFRKGDDGRNTVTGWDFTRDTPLSRTKAIKAKCLECQCGQNAEVERCQMTDCALWPYRIGTIARGTAKLGQNSSEFDSNDD